MSLMSFLSNLSPSFSSKKNEKKYIFFFSDQHAKHDSNYFICRKPSSDESFLYTSLTSFNETAGYDPKQYGYMWRDAKLIKVMSAKEVDEYYDRSLKNPRQRCFLDGI